MIASFSLLHPEEFDLLPRALTLFLFPLGGVEQHGPHLPLGTKLLQAEELAKQLAQDLQARLPNWNFILMPLLPLSVDTVTNRLALSVRPHVVRDAIVDQCEHLKRLQFQNFAAVSSHLTPKQLTAIEDAAKIVSTRAIFGSQRAQLISVTSALIDSKQVFDSPMIALPKEHGGATDTGLLLKWAPNLVLKNYSELQDEPTPRSSVSRFFSYLKNEIDGYWGKPKSASHSLALTSFEADVKGLTEKMLPWLEQGKGGSAFKTGYRFFPVNGSFFKAYLLASLFFFSMLIWVILSIRGAFEN